MSVALVGARRFGCFFIWFLMIKILILMILRVLIWKSLIGRFNYFDLSNFLILFVICLEFKIFFLIWIR
jgi:hypothetical protein